MLSRRRIKSWYRNAVRWVATRWRMLLRAVVLSPAVLVGASILWLGVFMTGREDAAISWYRREAARCMAAKDYSNARLCYASLVKRKPDESGYKYGLAAALSKLGEQSASAMLMRQLAPEDGPGYLPAQLDVAQQLLGGSAPTPEALRSAEARLQQILKVHPKHPAAHAMLAVLYARADQWDLAKPHMALGGPAVDELALPAALTFVQRGDDTESEIWARRAIAYYAPRVKADPKNSEQCLKYAQANLLLRDFAKTIEILDAGWQQSRHPAFPKAVAHVSSLWLKQSPNMDAPRRLALLENGLKSDPQNLILLQLLLDPATAAAAASVQPTTAPVQGAAVRAFVGAVDASRRRHPEQARPELQLALDLGGPQMPSIASNLACVWADSEVEDAACALTLSTTLLELRPDDLIARRAQGIVLSRQKQWPNAIEHLEAALAAMPDDPAIHAAMATAYENLGQKDLAATHRRLSAPTTIPTTTPTTRTTHK